MTVQSGRAVLLRRTAVHRCPMEEPRHGLVESRVPIVPCRGFADEGGAHRHYDEGLGDVLNRAVTQYDWVSMTDAKVNHIRRGSPVGPPPGRPASSSSCSARGCPYRDGAHQYHIGETGTASWNE